MRQSAVHDPRPVVLSLAGFSFPITAIASIAHRVTGMALVVAMAGVLWLADFATRTDASYAVVAGWVGSIPGRFICVSLYAILIYHGLAGIRHMVQDFGYWESLRAARVTAWLVLGLAALEWLGGLVLVYAL